MPFLGATPEHWCRVPELELLPEHMQKNFSIPLEENNGDVTYSQCTMFVARDYSQLAALYRNGSLETVPASFFSNVEQAKCQHGWLYDASFRSSTLVTEWDLVCGKQALAASAQSVYMLGMIAGCYGFGTLADMKGRKWTVLLSSLIFALSATAASFSPNLITFFILRLIIGAASAGTCNAAYIYGIESVGPLYRNRVGVGASLAYSTGHVLVALCAWVFRDWRYLEFSISIWLFAMLIWYFIIPESPRWLYAQGRMDECEHALRRVAKRNRKAYPDHIDLKQHLKSYRVTTTDGKSREANITDLVRTPNMRKISFIMWMQWFTVALVYYGLALNSANLGTNPYMSFVIMALVGYPANYPCTALILKHLGRRLSLSLTALIGGASCLFIALPWPTHLNWVIVTLATIGMFGANGMFTVNMLYTGELYPTVVRNIGFGTGFTWARFAGLLAPYVVLLGKYSRELPLIISVVLAIAAAIMALFLPEP
ncbi:PREDICTED: solute carrier family 22 member 21-like isoform X2 [Priapulus caudatus]|nr:PREDICTED: solute carrier family 22 member 21-like isoform X2 [Priapulus caudatus]